jgi:hypothetical protein
MVAMTSSDAARVRVLAAVGAAAASATLRPPALLAVRPLRPLAPVLAAKLVDRSSAVDDPAGVNRRRRRLFARDPLRLSRAERDAVRHSRSWESRQPWIGELSACRERVLVAVAVDTVARICATAAWASPHLDGHHGRLDLAAELDQVDAQACALAVARRPAADVEPGWSAIVDRVAALDRYATNLAALDRHLAALDAAAHADGQNAELSLGAARDAHASDVISGLAEELGSLSAAVAEVEHVRRRR